MFSSAGSLSRCWGFRVTTVTFAVSLFADDLPVFFFFRAQFFGFCSSFSCGLLAFAWFCLRPILVFPLGTSKVWSWKTFFAILHRHRFLFHFALPPPLPWLEGAFFWAYLLPSGCSGPVRALITRKGLPPPRCGRWRF